MLSRWMSEAPAFKASYKVEFTSLTAGLAASDTDANDSTVALLPSRRASPLSPTSVSTARADSSCLPRYAWMSDCSASRRCSGDAAVAPACACSHVCRSRSNGSAITPVSRLFSSRSSTQWRASACASGSRSNAGCWPNISGVSIVDRPNGSASRRTISRGSRPDRPCSSSTSERRDCRLCARARASNAASREASGAFTTCLRRGRKWACTTARRWRRRRGRWPPSAGVRRYG